MFSVQSDWLLCLEIFCTVHLRAKQDGVQFCLRYGRTFYFNKRSRRARQYQKPMKLGNQVSKVMYFFYSLAINVTQDVLKCFVYKWWVGDVPVCPPLFTSTSVNNCSLSAIPTRNTAYILWLKLDRLKTEILCPQNLSSPMDLFSMSSVIPRNSSVFRHINVNRLP